MNTHETLAPSLRAHFEILYRRQRLFGRSEDTVRLYRIAIDKMDEVIGREATIHDLSDDAILSVMQLSLDRGRANRTANRDRECLVALWTFLARKRIVDNFPDVQRLPEPQNDPVAWSHEELRRLWEACRNATGMIGDMHASRWWLLLHSLLWDSADRIGPIRRAEWPQVNWDTGWMTLPAGHRKGRRQSNTFRLHADTLDIMRPVRKPDGQILPWPYSYTYLYRAYKKLLKSAGLASDRFHKFHAMRRSAGSFIAVAGGDATRALGHSSEKITRRHYLDPTIVGAPQASDILFRPDGG